MSFAHKVFLWVMQRRGLPCETEQRAEFFSQVIVFVLKLTSV